MGTTGQSITLANSIIGVGILAMPFCFQQCGVVLASLILLSMGLVSRLCCYFLLKSALIARRRTFEFLAFQVFGSAGKCAVEIGIIGFLMGSCIAYFVVVGDLGPQIISKMFNINQSDILRTSIMVVVSLVCVLPLGLLRNVDSLSNVSAATICFYFCLVLKVILEAGSQLLSGASEWTTRVALWRPAGLLQCVPILSMALFCQTQLFEIFESMPTLSLEKMTVVSRNAIHICTAVYFTLGLFGYIAFNDHEISGNILMSLSPTTASDVIKLGFVMSVAFSFPLIIFPCRASLYSFLYKKVHSSQHDHIIKHSIPETSFRCITVAIIAVSLIISLLIPNIELVLGLVGSTIGVLICVVFPAACFVNVTFKNTNERILAKGIVILGLLIMVLGTYANLEAAENKHERYDETKVTQERIDKIVEDFFEKMEKSEGGKSKAIKPIPQEEVKINGVQDAQKNSEVQPPNPVPPEPSDEKAKKEQKIEVKTKPKPKDIAKLKDKENDHDRVSETHPKNLKKSNGVNLNKDNEIKAEIEKPEEVVKPALEENESKPKELEKVEEKKEIIKQQQLIETIKQHGQEQKELLKEQKELLDEIIKTKNEMEQNKKEVDSNEAKKIAVESIQKIADVAIKSLSGVTDKPIAANEEPLEQVANKAVQEIAKKAVETIEAIKEIKQIPLETAPKQDNSIGQSDIGKSGLLQNNVKSIQNVHGIDQNNPPQNGLNQQPIVNVLQAVNEQQEKNRQLNSFNDLLSENDQQPSNTNVQPSRNIEQQQQQQAANNQNVANVQQQQNIQQSQKSANVQEQQSANIQHQQIIQQSQQSANMQQQPAAHIIQAQEQSHADIQPLINNQEHAIQPSYLNMQQQSNIQEAKQLHENVHEKEAQQDANIQQNLQQNAHKQPLAKILQQAANLQPQYQKEDQDAQKRQNREVKNTAPVTGKEVPVHNEIVSDVQPKSHSHSPDEPESYKEGEDFELEKLKKIAQNLPIPIAMNGNVNGKSDVEKQNPSNTRESEIKSFSGENHNVDQQQSKNVQQNSNKIKINIIQEDLNNVQPKLNNIPSKDANSFDKNLQDDTNNSGPIRRKREVVDCTKTNDIKPEDREICKNLVSSPKLIETGKILKTDTDLGNVELPKHIDTETIFKSNIDLGNVELPKNIPMHESMIHHLRSLKSVPHSKKR